MASICASSCSKAGMLSHACACSACGVCSVTSAVVSFQSRAVIVPKLFGNHCWLISPPLAHLHCSRCFTCDMLHALWQVRLGSGPAACKHVAVCFEASMHSMALTITPLLLSINGLTHINLTKLDVLSDMDTLQLGMAYNVNGRRLTTVPAQLEVLEAVTVEYEELPGWKSDISNVSHHPCPIL